MWSELATYVALLVVTWVVAKQYFASKSSVSGGGMKNQIFVSEINIYPIKSCRRINVYSAEVNDHGFVHDREWMVVKVEDKRFLTQRANPLLATITPHFTDTHLQIDAPAKESVFVPLTLSPDAVTFEAAVWADTVQVADEGDEVASWLSSYLNQPVRLVRLVGERASTNPIEKGHNLVNLPDGNPFLFANVYSLADLNTRLKVPVPMERFRPNVVVSGNLKPWQEDTWKHIRLAGMDLTWADDCARCRLTTVNQASGVKGEEPLATLGSFRRKKEKKDQIIFGAFMSHHKPLTNRITVGDVIQVIETRPAPEFISEGK